MPSLPKNKKRLLFFMYLSFFFFQYKFGAVATITVCRHSLAVFFIFFILPVIFRRRWLKAFSKKQFLKIIIELNGDFFFRISVFWSRFRSGNGVLGEIFFFFFFTKCEIVQIRYQDVSFAFVRQTGKRGLKIIGWLALGLLGNQRPLAGLNHFVKQQEVKRVSRITKTSL